MSTIEPPVIETPVEPQSPQEFSAPSLGRWRALQPLWHRDYRLLAAATTLSLFASGMWTIVMVFQTLRLDDRPAALSMVASGMSIGLLLFALVGGIVADRVSKRAIMLCVQACNVVAVGLIYVLGVSGGIQIWHLAIASFVLGSSAAFFYPAYSAFLPRILPADQLLAANGLEGALRPTFGQALGPAVGGMVVAAFLPSGGALVITGLYGSAFLLLSLLRPEPLVEVSSEAPAERPSFLADLWEGVRFTAQTPWLLWTLLFASGLLLVIMGPIEVLLPFITRERFSNGEQSFGFLLMAFGVGGAVGSLAMSSWRLPRRYLTVMVMLWGLGTLPLVVIGHVASFWAMALSLAAVGMTGGAAMVIWGTLLQRRVPHAMLGRVSSLDFFVSLSLMPLSIAVVGPIAEVVPVPVIFTAAGIIPVFLAVIAIIAGRMPTDEIANSLDLPR